MRELQRRWRLASPALVALGALTAVPGRYLAAQTVAGPDTVIVRSGDQRLRGLLWTPAGSPRAN